MLHLGKTRRRPLSVVKRILSSILAAVGLKVSRIGKAEPTGRHRVPVHPDFLVALHDSMGGRPTSFRCPVEKAVDFAGFGFAREQFHPFVEALRIRDSLGDTEAEAFLRCFYDRHKPKNAAAALLDFPRPPEIFSQLKPHLHIWAPWVALSPKELSEHTHKWVVRDYAESGHPAPNLTVGDFPRHGPATDHKLRLEFNRLRRLADSIKANGYDRTLGDCSFVVIRRGDDFRFIPHGGGYHRMAAMAALQYDWVPGRILGGSIVFDYADVDYWSQVRKGVWTKTDALAYVDYLFDYNSRDWYLRKWDHADRAAHNSLR